MGTHAARGRPADEVPHHEGQETGLPSKPYTEAPAHGPGPGTLGTANDSHPNAARRELLNEQGRTLPGALRVCGEEEE